MIPSIERPRVLIVGAGLAGTATAIRLLRFARSPVEIILLEQRSAYRSAGVAYHRDGNPWDHVFNIQAGRMSVFREDVFDFVRWANSEADRRDWPKQWIDVQFDEHGPAPRRIFQDYLIDRLAEAGREACPGVVLTEADGEAVDMDPRPACVEVTIRQISAGKPGPGEEPPVHVLLVDRVIVATGLELKEPAYAATVQDHPRYIRHPYSTEGIQRLSQLPPEASVAIVGSVLSAYDSAALLLRQGHTGRIHMISRTGTMFRTYPGGHEHGVVSLPRPAALLEPYQGRDELLIRIRKEWETACAAIRGEHPDIDPVVVAERVTKAWEPYIPEALEQIPTAELRSLLDEFSTAIAAARVSAMEYTTAVIRRAMDAPDGCVELIVGKVEAIEAEAGESGRLVVCVAAEDGRRMLEADLVVSNFGRETDYGKVTRPLWRNLLRKGIAVPHVRTGRGVEVDERGVLLGSGRKPAGPIWAVGTLREGDEIVRNGRTGAFAFNLAAIKNQSIVAAAHVLEGLESREDASVRHWAEYDDYVGNLRQAAVVGFEKAVVLEVRRLAARTRDERELLDARQDACIRSCADGAPDHLSQDASRHDRLTRVMVNRAAVARLTDVSVTPRQLRRQLGLEGIELREG